MQHALKAYGGNCLMWSLWDRERPMTLAECDNKQMNYV
jgi:hypothetical protein